MTVRSIVEMFESMAASSGVDSAANAPESPERGNVCGLVTYYDGLAVVEETPMPVATKTVRLERNHTATSEAKSQPKAEEDSQPSNQEVNEAPVAYSTTPSLPSKEPVARNCSLLLSKIPQPKSREFHLAACSVRKPSAEDASRSHTSSSDASQSVCVPPPTPMSVRVRSPCSSYAAFVARIESSHSRLLDFEKDERWLGQVENMKGRVETLKRRNHMTLVREVASTPRKSRSMSECSGVSTASTASLSSIDTPEISYQQI